MLDYFTVDASAIADQQWKELTVIVPVRYSESRDIIERLNYLLQDRLLEKYIDKVSFIVVDDGSSTVAHEKIKAKAEDLGMSYLYVDASDRPFSIARARNIGAMYARSTHIMFMDVDLYPYDGFYRDLINEIEIQNLNKFANDFIMVGVIYLTKLGVEQYFQYGSDIRKNMGINWLLEEKDQLIEKFSTGTSVCIYNRDIYLANGGNDESFNEWGYEDLDFNLRMIRQSRKFPMPQLICDDYKNFRHITEYKGWKSAYRLFGDMTFQKGIVLFHIWHDVDESSSYMKTGRERNRRLFQERCESFHDKKYLLSPLPDPYEGKTLSFGRSNPFVANKSILPKLGIIYYKSENIFTTSSLLQYIQDHHIDRVLFFNPYASDHRLELYNIIKENNIPYIVAERGALRDSVFFDPNGFNAESSSYDAVNWDMPLSSEEYELVSDYIKEEKSLSVSLEEQAKRKSLSSLYSDLNVPLDKKILFVPLQRPSDTVIKYFCGDLGTYDSFLSLIQDVANNIPPEWVVVLKKHPLEDNYPQIDGVIFSEANIKDLIEISDSILVINSGVGILSLLWEKPVMYAGEVFYGDDRMNKKVSAYEDVLRILDSSFQPDHETLYRFLYFLIARFYSFGKFTTTQIPWEDGGRMTITKEIDFYQIRNLGKRELNMYVERDVRIKSSSILFDRYKNSGMSPALARHDNQLGKEPSTKFQLSFLQKTGVFIFRVLIGPFIQSKKAIKLRCNPREFFFDSKNNFTRKVGKLLRLI